MHWLCVAALAVPVTTQLQQLLQAYTDLGRFQGSALVACEGEVVLRAGFGKADLERDIDNTPETRHRVGSLAKSFTAAIILQMVDEGRLELHAPVSAYLPELRPEYAARITLHHLLGHTSGVRVEPQGRAARKRAAPYAPRDIVRLVNVTGLLYEPGTRYRYSDIGYSVLAAVIEEQEGKPFHVVLRERILDPLEMHGTGLVSTDPDPAGRSTSYDRLAWGETEKAAHLDESFAIGAGGMYSTVDDLYRWNRALDGDTLLSDESRASMFTAGLGSAGYGWRIGTYTTAGGGEGRLAFSYGGARGAASVTLRLIDDGHLVVLLGNIRQVPLAELATNIANVLVGVPVKPPSPPLKPLYDLLVSRGVDAAVERFAGKPDLPEELAINRLGYELMNRGRLDEAIRVFQFNVRAYPDAWNTYDSLAEAYMNAGDYLTAERYYNLSIELNPGNNNGKVMLQRLEARPGPF